MAKTVLVLSRNHFDNTWRRCWSRPYEYRGIGRPAELIQSYVTVERAVLDEMLALAARSESYSFEVESSRLLRRYIEEHPGAQETLRRLWGQGRFCLLGSGEVIPDANMPRGETLVRNLAEGVWWSREALGRRPRIGWHADGFGSSAQLPQIFAGCGMRWIAALSYKTPTGAYWRGLDGTVAYIATIPNRYQVDYIKYPPCPACRGQGQTGCKVGLRPPNGTAASTQPTPARCTACKGTGLHFVRRLAAMFWDDCPHELATLTYFGEEVLPPPSLLEAMVAHAAGVAAVSRSTGVPPVGVAAVPAADCAGETPATPGIPHRFATHEDLLPHVAAKLAACDNPPADEVSPEPDGNPSTSGGLVSRIELKRRHRFAEYALAAAEAWAALTGAAPPDQVPADAPRAQRPADHNPHAIETWEGDPGPRASFPSLRELWRDLCFGAFHDALPATHNDGAYAELMDLYDFLEDGCAAWLRAEGAPTTSTQRRGDAEKGIQKCDDSVVLCDSASLCRDSADAGRTSTWRLFNAQAKRGGVRELWPLGPLPDGPLALRIEAREHPVLRRTATLEGTPRLWADLPDLPPASAVSVEIVPAAPPAARDLTGETIRWSGRHLSFAAGPRGLTEIACGGRTVLKPGHWGIGELIVEHDVGDPWATRDLDRLRRGIARIASRVAARQAGGMVELVYRGQDTDYRPLYSAPDPFVLQLDYTQRWFFYADRPYVDLETEIAWSAYHRRVRLALPTPWPTDEMWTEIPFGVLRRGRYEMTTTQWNNANGDWPAIGWAAVEHGGSGLAVLNRGTPSHRCEGGTLLVSLLRSPAFPNCLEEPTSYSAPAYDGMRDPGRHVFCHRLAPYAGSWREAGIVEQAEAFAAPVALSPGAAPADLRAGIALPDGVALAALKRPHAAPAGGGLVLRLAEMHGQERNFELPLPPGSWSGARRCNLLEDPQAELDPPTAIHGGWGPLPLAGGRVRLSLRPWEIATVMAW